MGGSTEGFVRGDPPLAASERNWIPCSRRTLRTCLIFQREPHERHRSDDQADFALKSELAVSHVTPSGISNAPCEKASFVAPYQGRADDKPENRPSVIAAAARVLTLVLRRCVQSFVSEPDLRAC